MMELILDPKTNRWISLEELRHRELVEALTSYKELRNKQLIALAKGVGINLFWIRQQIVWIEESIEIIAKALNVQLPPKPSPIPKASVSAEVKASG